jgi:hypothetical protein
MIHSEPKITGQASKIPQAGASAGLISRGYENFGAAVETAPHRSS